MMGQPEAVLIKHPTAGLWGGQTDEDELGFTYHDADLAIVCLEELGLDVAAAAARSGVDAAVVERVAARVAAVDWKHHVPHALVNVDLDHTVVTVSDWERSNAFYRDVLGAEVVPRGPVVAYRFGDRQLNVHGPGFDAFPLPLHGARRGAATSASSGTARSTQRWPIWPHAASRSSSAPCSATAPAASAPACTSAIPTAACSS